MTTNILKALKGLNLFGSLQKIGKSLMLPVAVLPVAGLLLGIGSAHFGIIPGHVSDIMKASGDVIFGNLPLIFAIGVALGCTWCTRRWRPPPSSSRTPWACTWGSPSPRAPSIS